MKTWLLMLSLTLAGLSGCTVYDRRDRAYDPRPGHTLYEQIPPWTNAADKMCCMHLAVAEYKAQRCDTDRPLAPRSNRC